MHIQLPQGIANAVKTAASLRGYEDIADYIAALVREESNVEPAKTTNYQDSAQWREKLREWTQSHSVACRSIDLSRESIYEDRDL